MDWEKEAQHLLDFVDSGRGHLVDPVAMLRKGIEKVRALRKENEELRDKLERTTNAQKAAYDLAQRSNRRAREAEEKTERLQEKEGWLQTETSRAHQAEREVKRLQNILCECREEKEKLEDERDFYRTSAARNVEEKGKLHDEIERLEKEKAGLKEALDDYKTLNAEYTRELMHLGPETPALRDKFAMAALPAVVNRYDAVTVEDRVLETYARITYELADAMIEARNK